MEKRSFLTACCMGVLMFLASLNLYAVSGTWVLDPNHTYILWHVEHFGFSSQTGKYYTTGTLILDPDKPQNSKLDVTVHLGDVVTGISELDKHLKSKTFFDVDHFPTATFVSSTVELTSKTTATVHGILTLHGISKPIVLNVKLNQSGVNPVTKKPTLGFTAETQLNRSDFGMTALLPGLGDEVKLDIEAEASPR